MAGGLWPDGRAVVADEGSTLEIVVISRGGAVERTLGGPGEGPGEFVRIASVLPLRDDTVIAQDPLGRRITYFDATGVIETLPLAAEGNLRLLGIGHDGDLLMGPPLHSVVGRRYDTPWLSAPLVEVDRSTGLADTLAWADWDQSIATGGGNSPFMSGGFATVADGRFVVGVGNRPEVRWLDDRGGLAQVARWRDEPRPVSESMITAWEREMRAAFERVGIPATDIDERISVLKEAIVEPLPFFGVAGSLPRDGGLMADAEGNVWVAGYVPPRLVGPRRYFVLSPRGEWLGMAELPEGFRLLAIGSRHLLGVERNELDIQAVSLYELKQVEP